MKDVLLFRKHFNFITVLFNGFMEKRILLNLKATYTITFLSFLAVLVYINMCITDNHLFFFLQNVKWSDS